MTNLVEVHEKGKVTLIELTTDEGMLSLYQRWKKRSPTRLKTFVDWLEFHGNAIIHPVPCHTFHVPPE